MLYVTDSLARIKFVVSNDANLPNPGSNGIVARISALLTAARTIVAGSTKLVVTNGDGVSGNPTIDIGPLAASDIASGVFAVARIPALDASQISTGVFAVVLIPALDASKVTTGTFSLALIPNLPSSQLTSGQVALARGGTNADLSATGGTSKFLKQATAGAAITVVQPASSDLSDASNIPLLNANNHYTGNQETFDGTLVQAKMGVMSWTARSGDTVYGPVASDGFFLGSVSFSGNSVTPPQVDIISDANSPPSTVRQKLKGTNSSLVTDSVAWMIPVPKGHYYKAASSGGTSPTFDYAWWVPLGTNAS